jgi:hypothetical protein
VSVLVLLRPRTADCRLLTFLAIAATASCGGNTPPPVEPVEAKEAPKQEKSGGGPSIEYDLGGVDPNVWKSRVEAMKPAWNDCYSNAHEKQETLEGKLTFTVRTNKDGSVKWAYVKESDLGSRAVEKCILDAIRANNYGAPMDAKEGEIQAHSIGWQLDGDARAADPGAQANVLPSVEKARGKIADCKKKNDAKGTFTATIYVQKGGKPLSVGIAVDDPSAEAAADCVADVLMGLKYTNKASWPIKVTVTLP